MELSGNEHAYIHHIQTIETHKLTNCSYSQFANHTCVNHAHDVFTKSVYFVLFVMISLCSLYDILCSLSCINTLISSLISSLPFLIAKICNYPCYQCIKTLTLLKKVLETYRYDQAEEQEKAQATTVLDLSSIHSHDRCFHSL